MNFVSLCLEAIFWNPESERWKLERKWNKRNLPSVKLRICEEIIGRKRRWIRTTKQQKEREKGFNTKRRTPCVEALWNREKVFFSLSSECCASMKWPSKSARAISRQSWNSRQDIFGWSKREEEKSSQNAQNKMIERRKGNRKREKEEGWGRKNFKSRKKLTTNVRRRKEKKWKKRKKKKTQCENTIEHENTLCVVWGQRARKRDFFTKKKRRKDDQDVIAGGAERRMVIFNATNSCFYFFNFCHVLWGLRSFVCERLVEHC